MKIRVTKYIKEKIHRTKQDLRLDTFKSGGPGGQAQNKRNTGVRITDKITGLSSESRDGTGYDENKKSARRKLINKLVEHYREEEKNLIINKRELDKSVVRSYKEKNDLVIDHRTGKKYSFEEILDGKLDDIMSDLRRVLTNND